jgi:hypothetical protein
MIRRDRPCNHVGYKLVERVGKLDDAEPLSPPDLFAAAFVIAVAVLALGLVLGGAWLVTRS